MKSTEVIIFVEFQAINLETKKKVYVSFGRNEYGNYKRYDFVSDRTPKNGFFFDGSDKLCKSLFMKFLQQIEGLGDFNDWLDTISNDESSVEWHVKITFLSGKNRIIRGNKLQYSPLTVLLDNLSLYFINLKEEFMKLYEIR